MRTPPIAYPTKIATCCHCGSKAALKLDNARHELACASCGAPLHDLKAVPVKSRRKRAVTHQPDLRDFSGPVRMEKPKKPKKSKPHKHRRRKGWFGSRFKDLAEDVFDVVEDIFD